MLAQHGVLEQVLDRRVSASADRPALSGASGSVSTNPYESTVATIPLTHQRSSPDGKNRNGNASSPIAPPTDEKVGTGLTPKGESTRLDYKPMVTITTQQLND